MTQDDSPKIIKKNTLLLDNCYANSNTSTLTFRFCDQKFTSIYARLRSSVIKHGLIEGKDLYRIDHFFHDFEREEMQTFSQHASFSRNSYGSLEAIEQGEKPAQSMNGKERWQFFAKPPKAVLEIYKLFSTLADKLNAEITTLPWQLCDQSSHGSPAVIANKLQEASKESQELGKHQDCNPERNISFVIPILYPHKQKHHPNQFINGEKGKPWLISVMLYVTADHFLPEHGLGTVFYNAQNNIVLRANCLNMRLVLFQGDIFHSIEESTVAHKETTWRISYVFKLIINPREESRNFKKELIHFMNELTPIHPIEMGPGSRS